MDAKADWAGPLRSPEPERPPAARIFQEEWWLCAASSGRHERVTVTWDGNIVGSLPFFRSRRAGLTRLLMPPYTRTLGPLLHLPVSKPYQMHANRRRIIRDLVSKLPRHDHFQQALDPEAGDASGFHLAGFDIHHSFTFRITADESMEAVWLGLSKRLRNTILSTSKYMNVEDSWDFNRFLRLSRNERHRGGSTHDYATLHCLYEAALSRGQAAMRCAVGPAGDQVVVILIWDARTLYYWVSARANGSLSNRANAMLLWDAIVFAQAKGLEFDFDGYCTYDGATFMESFGRSNVVRPVVRRSNALYSTVFWLSATGRTMFRKSLMSEPT